MMEVKEIINMLRKAEGYISFNAEFANEIADILEELENISSKWNEIYESYRERLVKFRKENEDLKKQLAEKPEWISVEDRLPENGGFVAYYESDQIGSMTIVSNYYPEEKYHFSHWMPLPEPPKPKEPTFKDVFLKAFPKAATRDDGSLKSCAKVIFPYMKAGRCSFVDACVECWNQPYFEEEEGKADA